MNPTQIYEEKLDHFHLRVPKGTLEKYSALAKQRGVSLNQMIVEVLNDECDIEKIGGDRSEAKVGVLEKKVDNLSNKKAKLEKEINDLEDKKKDLLKTAEFIVEKLK